MWLQEKGRMIETHNIKLLIIQQFSCMTFSIALMAVNGLEKSLQVKMLGIPDFCSRVCAHVGQDQPEEYPEMAIENS